MRISSFIFTFFLLLGLTNIYANQTAPSFTKSQSNSATIATQKSSKKEMRMQKRINKLKMKAEKARGKGKNILDNSFFRLGLILIAAAIGLSILASLGILTGLLGLLAGLAGLAGFVFLILGLLEY